MSDIDRFPGNEVCESTADNAEQSRLLWKMGSHTIELCDRERIPDTMPQDIRATVSEVRDQAAYMQHDLSRDFRDAVVQIRNLARHQCERAHQTDWQIEHQSRNSLGDMLSDVNHAATRARRLRTRALDFNESLKSTIQRMRAGCSTLEERKKQAESRADHANHQAYVISDQLERCRREAEERHRLKVAAEIAQGPFNLFRIIPGAPKLPSDHLEDDINHLKRQLHDLMTAREECHRQEQSAHQNLRSSENVRELIQQLMPGSQGAIQVVNNYQTSASFLSLYFQRLLEHAKQAQDTPSHIIFKAYSATIARDWEEVLRTSQTALDGI